MLSVKARVGSSLLELLLAMGLGSLLLTAMMKLLLMQQVTYQTQNAWARLQENGRLIVQRLAQDIHMADQMENRSGAWVIYWQTRRITYSVEQTKRYNHLKKPIFSLYRQDSQYLDGPAEFIEGVDKIQMDYDKKNCLVNVMILLNSVEPLTGSKLLRQEWQATIGLRRCAKL